MSDVTDASRDSRGFEIARLAEAILRHHDPVEHWVHIRLDAASITLAASPPPNSASWWFKVTVGWTDSDGRHRSVSWPDFDLPDTGEDINTDADVLAEHVLALIAEADSIGG